MDFTQVRNHIKAVYFAACAVCFGYAVYQLVTGQAAWLWVLGFVAAYAIRMQGVTCGLHRLATHGSFQTFPVVKWFMLVSAAFAVQHVGQWVVNHRKHHSSSDDEGDPHSPNPGQRFRDWLHAQLLWFWSTKPADLRERVTALRERDPVLRSVDRSYPVWALLPFGLSFLIGGWTGEHFVRDGWFMMMWTNFSCLFLTYTMTGFVNSFGHFSRVRRERTKDYSQNFGGFLWPLVAWLTAGESFHGNHHESQNKANLGRTRWQIAFDPGTHLIWLLERCHLVWNVRWSWKSGSGSQLA